MGNSPPTIFLPSLEGSSYVDLLSVAVDENGDVIDEQSNNKDDSKSVPETTTEPSKGNSRSASDEEEMCQGRTSRKKKKKKKKRDDESVTGRETHTDRFLRKEDDEDAAGNAATTTKTSTSNDGTNNRNTSKSDEQEARLLFDTLSWKRENQKQTGAAGACAVSAPKRVSKFIYALPKLRKLRSSRLCGENLIVETGINNPRSSDDYANAGSPGVSGGRGGPACPDLRISKSKFRQLHKRIWTRLCRQRIEEKKRKERQLEEQSNVDSVTNGNTAGGNSNRVTSTPSSRVTKSPTNSANTRSQTNTNSRITHTTSRRAVFIAGSSPKSPCASPVAFSKAVSFRPPINQWTNANPGSQPQSASQIAAAKQAEQQMKMQKRAEEQAAIIGLGELAAEWALKDIIFGDDFEPRRKCRRLSKALVLRAEEKWWRLEKRRREKGKLLGDVVGGTQLDKMDRQDIAQPNGGGNNDMKSSI